MMDMALGDPKSVYWEQLRACLPDPTFARFATYVGFKQIHEPTWDDLLDSYNALADKRLQNGKIAAVSLERYRRIFRSFGTFLSEKGISRLADIDETLVEQYEAQRLAQLEAQREERRSLGKPVRRGSPHSTVQKDSVDLHLLFAHGQEKGMVSKNPIRAAGNPSVEEAPGASPFSGEELVKFEDEVGNDLAFLVLLGTGLRASDAVSLRYGEIDFDNQELSKITHKRKKRVFVPLMPKLMAALKKEQQRRNAQPADFILLNPRTGGPFTVYSLYTHVRSLGQRAGVPNAHPHRFRDTFVVDCLARRVTTYEISRMIGDTTKTIEKHYAEFIRDLREQTRSTLKKGRGLIELAKAKRRRAMRRTSNRPDAMVATLDGSDAKVLQDLGTDTR